MDGLRAERDLMSSAERKIRDAIADKSPGQAASEIVEAYRRLASPAERHAFVSVLATRAAIAARKCLSEPFAA